MTSTPSITRIDPGQEPAGADRALLPPLLSSRATLFIARCENRAAALLLDPDGPVTEPGVPALRLLPPPAACTEEADDALVTAMVAAATEHADQMTKPRLIALADPMNRVQQRVLERAGFRPGQRQPYFERGGGLIEYVTGYADATGAILELERGRTPGPV